MGKPVVGRDKAFSPGVNEECRHASPFGAEIIYHI
jgi:hypothetical protein